MQLEGKTTPCGWLVGAPVEFPDDHTGGYFSSCHLVTKQGQTAFLKALDIEKFDISKLLSLLAGFQYESELVHLCTEKRLSRVAKLIEAGHIERDASLPPALRNVPFLVFERAEKGDIRGSVDVSKDVSNQWRFFVLHQAAIALMQLHAQSIAHQDLKPSNLFVFSENEIKIGDLGRSSLRGKPAPHDDLAVPGASNYAPFEQRYGLGSVPSDWVERRLSTDVFHLGCLTIFVFTNICFPEYVMEKLADAYQPTSWGSSYDEVMPHIQACMSQALHEISDDLPVQFRKELIEVVIDLCNPDPKLRGRTRKGLGSQVGLLWLQRTASRFDVLEKAARVKEPNKNV